MAEQIKRHYDLTTLKVTLLADDQPAKVRCELQVTEQHQPETVRAWAVHTDELGLPATLDPEQSRGPGYRFELPSALVDELADVLHNELDPKRPLWLHLINPRGHLGLVPWEQLLVPRIAVPVLRVPDFIVEPLRSRHSLDVLLCADDPHATPEAVAEQIASTANTIAQAASLPTKVHVFASAPVHSRLLVRYRHHKPDAGKVLLYDPAGASTDGDLAPVDQADPAAGPPSPWLRWVRNEVCGHSMDIAHFLTPGNLTLGQGGLALSASPSDPDEGLQVLSTAAITRFTMQVGAWACVFGSPVDNVSEMGLRQAADTVAQLRPGSLLHHERRLDPTGDALAQGYRLLTATEPAPPPASPAMFLYCQPFQVVTEPRKHELLAAASPPESPLEPSPKLQRALAEETTSPTWLAATQRYVEQYEWRLRKWKEGAVGPPSELPDGVEQALQLIRDVVYRHADTPPNAPPNLHKSQVTEVSQAAAPTEPPEVG
jgi:hypothetical protein